MVVTANTSVCKFNVGTELRQVLGSIARCTANIGTLDRNQIYPP